MTELEDVKPAILVSLQQPIQLKHSHRLFCSTRLILALVGFLACVTIYTQRNDVSFAIVCMVNQTAADMISSNQPRPPNQCKSGIANTTSSEPTVSGSLVWSKSMQGLVLSAFYWGYMFSQVLGGYLAGRFGGKWIILGSVGTSTVLTLVSPICAIAHVGVFLAVRVIMGFSQGMMFPAFHSLWAQWAPPLERSLLTGITYAGNQIGMTIVMPISGVLCQYGFAHGWPSVYYVFGIAGIVWCAIWLLYGSDTPSVHRFISQEEKEFLEDELHETRHISDEKKPPIPWKAILKSKAVWGLWAGHFAADWGAYTMAAGLPLFLNDVLGLQLTEMGFLSAIPYLAYFVVINVATFAADAIRNAAWMTTLNVRRAAMIIALGSQAVFLVACGFCGCGQQALVIVFLTLGIGLSGASYAGFVVNYLDIAPTFAGPLLGTGQTVSCIAGILCPIIIGWLTPQSTQKEWLVVFWIAFVILILGTILFVVLASGDVQPWAILRKPTTRRTTMMQRLSMRLESKRESAFDIAEVARKLSKLVSSRSASMKDDDTEN